MANEHAKRGDLLTAEELYWEEIEKGNERARLHLAYSFHDSGLISLALEHYMKLQGSTLWGQASTQAASILEGVHQYAEALEVLGGISQELSAEPLLAIKSAIEKISGYVHEIPGAVTAWLREETKLLKILEEEVDLNAQIKLVEARKYLANYASVVSSSPGQVVAANSMEVEISRGLVVSRTLTEVLSSPHLRWFDAAHSAVNAFTLMSQTKKQSHEGFKALVLEAMELIEKKYVVNGRTVSQENEEYVINNLVWGLDKIGHPAKDFYTHLL